ncbi:MAG: TIGR01620 family protein [Magnetococcales bacterium]|nr:TIGR01620 family protein [Magnetococcales bacterium]
MLRPGSRRAPVEISPADRTPPAEEVPPSRPIILVAPPPQERPTEDPDESANADLSPGNNPDFDSGSTARVSDEENDPDATCNTTSTAPAMPATFGLWERLGTLFLVLMGSFLLLVLVQNLVLFLRNEYAIRPLSGGIFAFLALGGLGAAMVWLGREWYRLSQLRGLRQLAEEAALLAAQRGFSGKALALAHHMAPLYRHNPAAMAGWERFRHSMDDTLEDPQILHLFSQQVLAPVDAQAHQVVVSHVANTTLLTALSPLPLVDAVVFLWNTTRMVQKVALCYGVHPGTVGSWILLRDGCQGLLVAGTTDLLANHVSNILGDSLASLFLARAGQGMANGLFTARIGLQAMRLCRPLPFAADELPGMGRLRKTMAAALAQAFQGVPQQGTPTKEVQPG